MRKLKDLTAAQSTRHLLEWAGIPTVIPECFPVLTAKPGLTGPTDGPWFISEVRSRLVHPPKSLDDPEWPGDSQLRAAWQLGTWYLELALLRVLGYQGEYQTRLELDRYVGHVEPVPVGGRGLIPHSPAPLTDGSECSSCLFALSDVLRHRVTPTGPDYPLAVCCNLQVEDALGLGRRRRHSDTDSFPRGLVSPPRSVPPMALRASRALSLLGLYRCREILYGAPGDGALKRFTAHRLAAGELPARLQSPEGAAGALLEEDCGGRATTTAASAGDHPPARAGQ